MVAVAVSGRQRTSEDNQLVSGTSTGKLREVETWPEEIRLSSVLAARGASWLVGRPYPPMRLIDGVFEIPVLPA